MNKTNGTHDYPEMSPQLIAHCGINCGICYRYMQKENPCPGCRVGKDKKLPHPKCEIRACVITRALDHCYECSDFPCERINHLDDIYQKRYGMQLILNNFTIKNGGISRFLASEKIKWECPNCHGRLSVHLPACPKCHSKNPNMIPTNPK